MNRFLVPVLLALSILAPTRVAAEGPPLRITSPVPGDYREAPPTDVELKGPPNTIVSLRINDREPVLIALDATGRGMYSPEYPAATPSFYIATIESDGVVLEKTAVRIDVYQPALTEMVRRPASSKNFDRYAIALACGGGAVLASHLFSEFIAAGVERETDLHKMVIAAGLSVALSPAAVMTCLSDVKNAGSAWATAAGSAAFGLFGLAAIAALQDSDDTRTVAFAISIMAPIAAVFGAYASVQIGPDMMGAGYTRTF